jgi:hypothetical protein
LELVRFLHTWNEQDLSIVCGIPQFQTPLYLIAQMPVRVARLPEWVDSGLTSLQLHCRVVRAEHILFR